MANPFSRLLAPWTRSQVGPPNPFAASLPPTRTFEVHSLGNGGIRFKDGNIWGSDWRTFMGITGSGGAGVDEIQDSPGDWTRAYRAHHWIYRCVELRANMLGNVPLRIYEFDSEGNRGGAVDHEAIQLMENTNPTRYVSGVSNLIKYTLGSRDLHGHTGWRVATSKGGRPTEIYWLVPTSYRVIPDPQYFFGGLEIHTKGQGLKVIDPKHCVYLPTPNLGDPLRGISKITILRDQINLGLNAIASNKDFFANSQRPDMIVTGDWDNNPEEMGKIRRAWRRAFQGERNRSPLFLGKGASAQLLTMSAKDAEWVMQQRLTGEAISAVFGVNQIFLNDLSRATYENIQTARSSLYTETLIPDGAQLCQDLNLWYLWSFWPETRKKNLGFGFDWSKVEGLGEDVARQWERFLNLMGHLNAQVEKRLLTPNQARIAIADLAEQMGIDSKPWVGVVPGGETFYILLNNVPIEHADVQASINIAAARGTNPELVESVPGAESAGPNSQRVVDRITRQTEVQAAAQAEAAKQREEAQKRPAIEAPKEDQAKLAAKEEPDVKPQPPAEPPAKALLVDIESLLERKLAERLEPRVEVRTETKVERVIVKVGPNPIAVRDARLAQITPKLQRRLKRLFQDQQTEALRRIRGDEKAAMRLGDDGYWDHDQAKADLEAAITVGVTEAAKAAFAASSEDYGLDVAWSEDVEMFWLPTFMGSRLQYIQGIDDTTRQAVSDTLLEGSQAGEGIPDLAKRVTAVFDDAKGWRSENIARTETIQAYGRASIQSYRTAGVTQIMMHDGIGDVACSDVNGAVVSPDEADRLMAAEHPSGTRGCSPVLVDAADVSPEEVASSSEGATETLAMPQRSRKELAPGFFLVA